MILGIDEVGRGPWAGPLVMGAVVLGGEQIEGLTDSKKLTKKRREELEPEIYARAAGVGLGWVSARELDEVGMSEALVLACRRAVEAVDALGVAYHGIVIDGTINFLYDTPKGTYVSTQKKADLLVPSVSAASIVAKVARDRYMEAQDAEFPGYGFASHVGYGTAAHRAAIERLGVTPLHRLSFAPLQKYANSDEELPKKSRLRRVFSSKLSRSSAELAALKQSSPSRESIDENTGQSQNSLDNSSSPHPTTRQIGDASETVAAEELVRRGHEIIERNWKTKYCEIDIVSQKGAVLYFTEVKHRRNNKAGDGLAAITPKKLAQMKYAAEFYVHTNKLENVDLRLMAIATTGDDPAVTSVVEIK
jgi:ribonuclease HII